MGDRVIYNIKQKDGKYVSLYSHWGGSDSRNDLAKALQKAEPRWSDETYCARIITSQIIGDNWRDVLGFGIWASDEPHTYEKWYVIDMANQEIEGEDTGNEMVSFEKFVEQYA